MLNFPHNLEMLLLFCPWSSLEAYTLFTVFLNIFFSPECGPFTALVNGHTPKKPLSYFTKKMFSCLIEWHFYLTSEFYWFGFFFWSTNFRLQLPLLAYAVNWRLKNCCWTRHWYYFTILAFFFLFISRYSHQSNNSENNS